MKQFKLWVVLGVGCFTVAVLVFFVNNSKASNDQVLSATDNHISDPLSVPASTPISMAVLDPTYDWLRYDSATAKYSFRYPPDWPLTNVPVAVNCENCVETLEFSQNYVKNSPENTFAVVLVRKSNEIRSLEDYVDVHFRTGHDSQGNVRDAVVGSERALSYNITAGPSPLPIINYIVVKNGFIYEIFLYDSEATNKSRQKNIEMFDQMLESFSFFDS